MSGFEIPEYKLPDILRVEGSPAHQWEQESATPGEFDKRLHDVARSGVRPGKLVREVPHPVLGKRLSMREYEGLTLYCNRGEIHAIYGPIRERWNALGGSEWSSPTSSVTKIATGDGQQATFGLRRQGPGKSLEAAILWSRNTGAHHITGAVYKKFIDLGGVGTLGYPTEGTHYHAAWGGTVCRFRRAYQDDQTSAIVIRSRSSDAWAVYGGIHQLWDSMGGVQSPLGYPTGDEFGSDQERRQYFEDGTVIWNPDVGAFVEMTEWHLRFRGFHQLRAKPDEFTPNNEWYFFTSAIPRIAPEAGTHTTKLPVRGAEYDKMRNGRWRHDDVVVYHGTADTLLLTISGAERNTGDPNHHSPAIQEATKKAVTGAVSAIAGMIAGPVGVAGAVAVAPVTDVLGKELGKAINDLLKTGDKPLDPVVVTLNLATIRSHRGSPPLKEETRKADGGRSSPIDYHFIVDLSGDPGWLRLFFLLRSGAPR